MTADRSGNSAARPIAIYEKAVEKNFSFLKRTRRLDELFAKSIPLSEPAGYLLPVCDLHGDDPHLIGQLSRWRRENAFAYPTQFVVTDAGTASWLKSKLLEVPDRLLFLVLDQYGSAIGHLGFANCLNPRAEMEVDNVLRGVAKGSPGIMRRALEALLRWARETIGPDGFNLRVFEDNERAVRYYQACGFVERSRHPLRRHAAGETLSYRPVEPGDDAPPDKIFLEMVYAPPVGQAGQEMILTAGPSISARESFYTFDAARQGWNHRWNGYLTRFENSFAQYVGTRHALATSSCTGALHIALATLGVGPGDEVIVPELTWVATATAVLYVGATPVFADVEADSWCLDPASFEAQITPRTKAVIPVHLYGHPARMDAIMAVARRHNLFVIEDAAPAIGAEYQGQRTGTFGQFAAFSFQGAKLLVTGEGGMLVTNDDELFRKAHHIWDHGRDPTKTFWVTVPGVKYKMSNVQAALGLGQLERADELIEMKRRIFSWYAAGLEGVPGVRLNYEVPGARSIYWMSSLLLEEGSPISRDQLRETLRRQNIDTRPVFPAISQYPFWTRRQSPAPAALRIGQQALNLPSGVCLQRAQVDYVCEVIRQALKG